MRLNTVTIGTFTRSCRRHRLREDRRSVIVSRT